MAGELADIRRRELRLIAHPHGEPFIVFGVVVMTGELATVNTDSCTGMLFGDDDPFALVSKFLVWHKDLPTFAPAGAWHLGSPLASPPPGRDRSIPVGLSYVSRATLAVLA